MRIITLMVSIFIILLFMTMLSQRPLIIEMLSARSINAGDFFVDGSIIMIFIMVISFAVSKR